MPKVVIHKSGQRFEGEVKDNANLVVRAGIKQFPFPNLAYGCGMAKCAKCVSRIIRGGEALAAPNWKEQKLLGEKLGEGFRLVCQLWISADIELSQDEGDAVRAWIAERAGVGRVSAARVSAASSAAGVAPDAASSGGG